MKLKIFILLVFFCSANAQLKIQATSQKWIKTAIDTMTFTAQTVTPTRLTVTVDSLTSNTLEFRTDIDVTWRND